jgi:hypothetical protein
MATTVRALPLLVLFVACARDEGPAPVQSAPSVAEPASTPPASSPSAVQRGAPAVQVAAPAIDPTLRFGKNDYEVDPPALPARPIPWIPDVPELEAVLPQGTPAYLEESWKVWNASPSERWILHVIQIIARSADPDAEVRRVEGAAKALGGKAREDIPPVASIVDLGMAANDVAVRIERAPSAPPWWKDTARGPLKLMVRDTGRGSVQVWLAVGHREATGRPALEKFASTLPDAPALLALGKAIGSTLTHARYTRQPGMKPAATIDVERARSAAEEREMDAVLKLEGGISVQSVAGNAVGEKWDARRSRALEQLLGARGFRRTSESVWRKPPRYQVWAFGGLEVSVHAGGE